MNRKQRRLRAAIDINPPLPDMGPAISVDQGEALIALVENFLKENLGHVQAFAFLISNGEGMRVIGNAGPEMLALMLKAVSSVTLRKSPDSTFSGDPAGSA